jgi:hypothetical protein
VKRFLKEAGGIDQYPDVSITWIFHHEPQLFVYDALGRQVNKIDLATYDYAALHRLFKTSFRVLERIPAAELAELAEIANRTKSAQATASKVVSPYHPHVHRAGSSNEGRLSLARRRQKN